MRAYRYELVAVADGMIVMMLELVGSRLIAPYLGTSIYVWTAIIGVILGALAFGNWYGGRLADRGPSPRVLVGIMLVSAMVLMIEMLLQEQVVQWIAARGLDLRLAAFMIAAVVFAPPAVFMGMVAPYLAKLRLTSLEHAGQSVGRLYAAGTAGSIIGTFLAGYFLIGAIGSRTLGWSLVIALVAVSFIVSHREQLRTRFAIILVALVLAFTSPVAAMRAGYKVLYDGDSAYARYFVLTDATDKDTGRRYLLTDSLGIQSGADLTQPFVPVFPYTQRFVEAAEVQSSPPHRILMIGGGTFTVPEDLHHLYPQADIDVVEIDPALTGIAQQYFGYHSSDRIRIINQDGRYFLNHNRVKYDMVYVDAFSSLTPPFQLTTREAAQRIAGSLSDRGVLVVNLVTAAKGPAAAFGNASLATYGTELPLRWYVAGQQEPLEMRQNTIVLGSRSPAVLADMNVRLGWTEIPIKHADKPLILTDDRAPVEMLTSEN
jgi:predicted membrane-bound spermidine synthase